MENDSLQLAILLAQVNLIHMMDTTGGIGVCTKRMYWLLLMV